MRLGACCSHRVVPLGRWHPLFVEMAFHAGRYVLVVRDYVSEGIRLCGGNDNGGSLPEGQLCLLRIINTVQTVYQG